jgi:hypothetical protein
MSGKEMSRRGLKIILDAVEGVCNKYLNVNTKAAYKAFFDFRNDASGKK